MPYEPQQFIHAANVRLDVPVSVHLSKQLTDDLRNALEDATLTSFDSVVESCIARRVDFLLLSGNIFLEADRSLRARLTLLAGFRRLHEKQIPVYVLPGDTDPPEAWRIIPEMPDNVTVCYSSDPEPEVLIHTGRVITTFSASMWYGETDAFGIRVIGRGEDGLDPFRIGIVSQAKYDESLRMASLSLVGDEDFLNVGQEKGVVPDSESPAPSVSGPANSSRKAKSVAPPETKAPDSKTTAVSNGQHSRSPVRTPAEGPETRAEYEAGFRRYIDQLMVEGSLNYVALMGELDRLTITLDSGRVHCPGTTQPRSQLEADAGQCSLVKVDAAGQVTFEEINTSAVEWKNIDLIVAANATLNGSLQKMKALLLQQKRNASDRIWAVCWTVRGPLPVLQDFVEEDLELAVAVELEELAVDGRTIRLVHEIRTLPDPWELPDKESLGQQYADLLTEDAIVSRRRLMNLVRRHTDLTEGWRQRFEALVAGVDRERILARMRVDGAHWFVADPHVLLPDLDDFDVDILKDEPVEEFGLTGDDPDEDDLEPDLNVEEYLGDDGAAEDVIDRTRKSANDDDEPPRKK
ncbi:MAG: hypothetical protein R3C49_17225 [Planctomycetaceae bacterium]